MTAAAMGGLLAAWLAAPAAAADGLRSEQGAEAALRWTGLEEGERDGVTAKEVVMGRVMRAQLGQLAEQWMLKHDLVSSARGGPLHLAVTFVRNGRPSSPVRLRLEWAQWDADTGGVRIRGRLPPWPGPRVVTAQTYDEPIRTLTLRVEPPLAHEVAGAGMLREIRENDFDRNTYLRYEMTPGQAKTYEAAGSPVIQLPGGRSVVLWLEETDPEQPSAPRRLLAVAGGDRIEWYNREDESETGGYFSRGLYGAPSEVLAAVWLALWPGQVVQVAGLPPAGWLPIGRPQEAVPVGRRRDPREDAEEPGTAQQDVDFTIGPSWPEPKRSSRVPAQVPRTRFRELVLRWLAASADERWPAVLEGLVEMAPGMADQSRHALAEHLLRWLEMENPLGLLQRPELRPHERTVEIRGQTLRLVGRGWAEERKPPVPVDSLVNLKVFGPLQEPAPDRPEEPPAAGLESVATAAQQWLSDHPAWVAAAAAGRIVTLPADQTTGWAAWANLPPGPDVLLMAVPDLADLPHGENLTIVAPEAWAIEPWVTAFSASGILLLGVSENPAAVRTQLTARGALDQTTRSTFLVVWPATLAREVVGSVPQLVAPPALIHRVTPDLVSRLAEQLAPGAVVYLAAEIRHQQAPYLLLFAYA